MIIRNNFIVDFTDFLIVTRMLILLQHGGIYLDSDVLLLKSLDPLRNFEFTIGRSTELSLSKLE